MQRAWGCSPCVERGIFLFQTGGKMDGARRGKGPKSCYKLTTAPQAWQCAWTCEEVMVCGQDICSEKNTGDKEGAWK